MKIKPTANLHHIWIGGTVALTLCLTCNAWAAMKLEIRTERQSDEVAQDFSYHVIRDGDRSSTAIESDHIEMLPDKSRLVTDHSTGTVSFVSADSEQCVSWKVGDFAEMLGRKLMKLTDRHDVTIRDPKITKIHERPADPILGYPVTETRWDLEAVITVPLLFMEVDWEMKREVTLWQTEINNLPENPRIEELSWHHTGLAELDEVLDVSVASDEHFILKSNIYQEINAPVGNPPKLNITQEVKSLNVLDADPPTAIFATPECTAITKEQLREQANDLIWLLYGKQIQ